MKKLFCHINNVGMVSILLCASLAGGQALLADTNSASSATSAAASSQPASTGSSAAPATNASASKSASSSSASAAASTEEAAPEAGDYNNWVEVGAGGLLSNGNRNLLKSQQGYSGDVFGGIEDMHIEQNIDKDTQLIWDGRAIFDNRDYKLKLEITRQDLGYIHFGYTQYRIWENDTGGFDPQPGSGEVPNDLNSEQMAIDRSDAWVELGLRIPDVPDITLRFDRETRNGMEDSLEWGSTAATVGGGYNLMPSFRDINEERDIVTGDAKKTYDITDVDLGMRYEFTNDRDSEYIDQNATPILLTEQNSIKSDTFSGHASQITRFNDEVWLTSSYSYSTMDSTISGSNIYGTVYDPVFSQSLIPSHGDDFFDLSGGSTGEQNVGTLNVLWTPIEDFSITPEFRVEGDDTEGISNFTATTNGGAPGLVGISTENKWLTVDEACDIRYTGVEDWVFYTRLEFEQQDGNTGEGSTGSVASDVDDQYLNLNENTTVVDQKYTVGANWYPLTTLNFTSEYSHNDERNSNSINNFTETQIGGVSPTAQQTMLNLNMNTDDMMFRATWKPLTNITLVSRYDFQYSTIYSRWETLGLNTTAGYDRPFDTGLSGDQVNHMFTETATCNPFARWYIQGTAA